MKEIAITEIEGFTFGSTENKQARTGVTVILAKDGAVAGVDISGGGPASRETPLLRELSAPRLIHAAVLSGGSAFGLAACDGVMRYLEEHDIGYQTHFAKVPLVVGACLYDLNVGDSHVRPDSAMGYAACVAAEQNAPVSGPVGAGCGATVGKLRGVQYASPSGLGVYAVQIGSLKVGAVTAVNAMGDIFDHRTGEKIAGMRNMTGDGFGDSVAEILKVAEPTDLIQSNTTISCIVTNGRLDKSEMNKAAAMARCAYARCIRPVGTTADGDSIFTMSSGTVSADVNMVGTLAAEVLCEAIRRAVTCR